MHPERSPLTTLEDPPFIDRVRERGLLFEHLNAAKAGKGGMVLLEGEAGIGKSRLVADTVAEAKEKGFHQIIGKCFEDRRSPYLPFIEMLRQHFGVHPGRPSEEKRESLERSIIEGYPSLRNNLGAFINLLVPPEGPLGSYKASRVDLIPAILDLRRRGFRTLVLTGGDLPPEVSRLFDPADTIAVDLDQTQGNDPKGLERLAVRLRGVLNREKHWAVINCTLHLLLDHYEGRKGHEMLKVLDYLAANNDGICIHLVPQDIDRSSGPPLEYEEYSNLIEEAPGPPGESQRDGPASVISTYELVPAVVLELSRRHPLLVVVEDLQWGDKATLNLIQYMARMAKDEQMLILGSYRPEGIGPEEGAGEQSQRPLREALQRISRERLFDIIKVGRFDKETTGLLLGALMGRSPEQSLIDQVFQETEGIPLYILERQRALSCESERTKVPKGNNLYPAEGQVVRSVSQLGPLAREVLDLASVIGRATKVEEMVSISGRCEEELLDAIDSLNRMRFLRETDDGLVFEHNKVRETVRSQIPPEKKSSLHLKVACWLESDLDVTDPDAIARLGEHYFMAGDFRKALELSLASSELSLDRSHMDKAQRTLEMALQCLEHIDDERENWPAHIRTLLYLGDIHQRRGELFKALNRYIEARDISEKRTITKGLPSIYRRMGDTMIRLFDWDQTLDNYLRSLRLSKKEDDRSEVALSFRGLGRVYYLKGDYNRALECYMKFLEETQVSKTSNYVLALQEIGEIYNEMGDFNQALTYYKLSIRTGEEKSLPKETALSYVRMSNVLLRVGDLDDARRFSDVAFSRIRDNLGDDISEKVLIGYIEMMIEFGDLERAEDGATLIPGGLQGAGSDRLIDAIKARINALLLARRRDFSSSNTEMERAILVLQELQVPFQLALTYLQSGLIRFQCMEVDKAKELLIKASDLFKNLRSLHYMSRTASKLREVTFIMEGMSR